MKSIVTLVMVFTLLGCFSNGDNNAEEVTTSEDANSKQNYIFSEFSTDYRKSIISFDDILSGGPPKDGIPALDAPKFTTVTDADTWMDDTEPVLLYTTDTTARVYPIQILMWHEIVNDRIDGIPVTITYCPLCNTGIGFLGEIDGRELDFGTTGRLRYSNLIMYDRQTETWWQQATGEGIVGEHTGRKLEQVPVLLVPWKEVKSFYQNSQVLSVNTGFSRPYGQNPYSGYDNPKSKPFLYRGPDPGSRLSPLDRVIAVEAGGAKKIYSYSDIQKQRVITDTIDNERVVIFWEPGTASALDTTQISSGRDVGTANAFSTRLEGDELNFRYSDGSITDAETDSRWNVLGIAVSGPMQGNRLNPVTAVQHFWFSASAFFQN